MEFIVSVYVGDKLIPKDQVKNFIINSPVLNSIIIDAAERRKMVIDDVDDKKHLGRHQK